MGWRREGRGWTWLGFDQSEARRSQIPPETSVTSARPASRLCTARSLSALLPKIFDRPGPKSVSAAVYSSAVAIVVAYIMIVDMFCPSSGSHSGSAVPACSATM